MKIIYKKAWSILIILSNKDYRNLERNYDFQIELNLIKESLLIFFGDGSTNSFLNQRTVPCFIDLLYSVMTFKGTGINPIPNSTPFTTK